MTAPVLAIDDDQGMCEMIRTGLGKRGYEVEWRTQGPEGLELISERDFAAVITDLNLEHMSGLELCERVVANRPNIPVIVITAFGDMESAIAAIRAGAYDFINKPFEMEALAHTLDRAIQHRRLSEEVKRLTEQVNRADRVGQLIGESAAMRKVFDLIHRVAQTDASVLVSGESGTGKELVAKALHAQSPRANKQFVAVNCAAVPANLLESELFGHVKGAFTDARATRKGLFEHADGGTLLFDEISEMPLEMQPKLLRVLQERKVRPVGGSAEVSFDTRLVASTNRDLETEVEEGRFREDLFYRLNVVQIHMPALRARGNDILILAQHFIRNAAAHLKKEVTGLSTETAKKLLEYDWPGNVRQLENVMERAVTLTRFDQVTVDDLPDKIKVYESTDISRVNVDAEHMLTLEEVEHRYIERVLQATNGNKTQAAKVLGLDRRTLYRKLERYEKESA